MKFRIPRMVYFLASLICLAPALSFANDTSTKNPIIGMYIHQHWPFNRPYAARTWTMEDWRGYVGGLRKLGYNTIQIWPMLETMPEPLTPSDKNNLAKIAKVIDMAHDLDMRVYLVISANVIPNDALAAQATFAERHFFHCDLRVNPADKNAVRRMMARRKELFRPVAKTDGVSIIDSDPGGYPGSTNEEFISLLGEHRKMLDSLRPGIELIYWLHVSWPAYSEYYQTNRFRWGKIAEYEQALTLLKTFNPEPWGFANGLQLAEKLGISESRVINFRYGAIEAEPSYPLTNFGGDQAYEAGGQGAPKGVMGNAQAHCVQLPNTFAFARGALHKPIEEKDSIQFANDLIPGQGKLIVDAWKTLNADSPKAIYSMIQKLEQVNNQKLNGGPLQGLLFNEPHRFITDLILQLRFKSAYIELYTASKNDKPIKEPFGNFLKHLEAWQERHGYENYWGFRTYGSWPELSKALDKINDPLINQVLEPKIQAKTPFGQVKEEFYHWETFTPQLIKAMRSAWRRM